jgi:hypothetical protein
VKTKRLVVTALSRPLGFTVIEQSGAFGNGGGPDATGHTELSQDAPDLLVAAEDRIGEQELCAAFASTDSASTGQP